MKNVVMLLWLAGATVACTTEPESQGSAEDIAAPDLVIGGEADRAETASAAASTVGRDDPGEAEVTAEAASALTGATTAAGNGCSIVQYCNAPGSDGSRCIQKGCDVVSALIECLNEIIYVCGEVTPPGVLVELNGTRFTFR